MWSRFLFFNKSQCIVSFSLSTPTQSKIHQNVFCSVLFSSYFSFTSSVVFFYRHLICFFQSFDIFFLLTSLSAVSLVCSVLFTVCLFGLSVSLLLSSRLNITSVFRQKNWVCASVCILILPLCYKLRQLWLSHRLIAITPINITTCLHGLTFLEF